MSQPIKRLNIAFIGNSAVNKLKLLNCFKGKPNNNVNEGQYTNAFHTIPQANINVFTIDPNLHATVPKSCDMVALCISGNSDLKTEIDDLILTQLQGIASNTKICLIVTYSDSDGDHRNGQNWSLADAEAALNTKLTNSGCAKIFPGLCFMVNTDNGIAFSINNSHKPAAISELFSIVTKEGFSPELAQVKQYIRQELEDYRHHVQAGMFHQNKDKVLKNLDKLITEIGQVNDSIELEVFQDHLNGKKEKCFGHHAR